MKRQISNRERTIARGTSKISTRLESKIAEGKARLGYVPREQPEAKDDSPFQNRINYNQAVHKARDFKDSLTGDNRYELPEVNRVALESRVVGWVSAQPWFLEYREQYYSESGYPESDFWMEVADFALQVSQDAITTVDPLFMAPGNGE